MKLIPSLLSMACFSLLLFSSCEKKDDVEEKIDTPLTDKEYVNKWIYEQMNEWYLWRDEMPKDKLLDFDIDSETFFGKLLYAHESRFDGLVFSHLESNHDNLPKASRADSGATESSLGFEYIPLRTNSTSYPVIFAVVYVHKGTNAATQGIKRGDVIFKVDGKTINTNNYNSILPKSATNYTFNITNYQDGKNFDLTITPTSNYEENPIYLDTIYIEGNKKIGYLVYNQYEFGNSSKRPYDVELAEKLTNFKNKGITDFILDLRYNGGGYVASAQALCSALVPNRDTKNIFEIKSYNSIKQAQFDALPENSFLKESYLYDYFVDEVLGTSNKTLATIPKLGDQINSLYIIATGNTASASELTINSLRAYRNIVLVGDTTTGKNIGGWALSKNNDARNTYVISPIIFKSYNKNKESDYSSGFSPNIKADDFEYLLSKGIKALGNKNETLLNAAISGITGVNSGTKTRSTDAKLTRLKGSSLDRKPNAYKLLEVKDLN